MKSKSKNLSSEKKQTPILEGVVWVDSERLGGTPCFYGTRVPIMHLFDHLEGGDSIDDFLDGFEEITQEQVEVVLSVAKNSFFERIIKK